MSFVTTFNVVDLIALAFMLGCVVIGVLRGFTSDFFGLFTWITAGLLTNMAFPYVRPLMRQLIHATFIADIISAFVLFILLLIFSVFLVKVLVKLVHASGLAGLDRSLGILSGFFRGTVVLTILYMVALMFWKPGEQNPVLKEAKIEPFLVFTTKVARDYIIPDAFFPRRIRDHLEHHNQKPIQTSEQLVQSLSNPKPAAQDKTVDQSKVSQDQKLTFDDLQQLGHLVHKVSESVTP